VRRVIIVLLGTFIGGSVLLCLKSPERRPPVACAPANPHPSAAPRTRAPTRRTAAARTILGDAFPAKDFGNVQVQVVMTGPHLDDVVAVQMSGRPLSAPAVLREQALTKQNADLTNISGATYTCAAYKQSLQSALDRA
jgi:uncharacterized protein with FMN-binding domain